MSKVLKRIKVIQDNRGVQFIDQGNSYGRPWDEVEPQNAPHIEHIYVLEIDLEQTICLAFERGRSEVVNLIMSKLDKKTESKEANDQQD
jgi:hypothetical protein